MVEEDKKNLQQKLWAIANDLRGNMGADEFRDYILGFIFYKYLSERMETYANELLNQDGVSYLDASSEYLDTIKDESIEKLGYFLKPEELFSQIAIRGNGQNNNFILEDLAKILRNIEQSTMGYESEDDFHDLFSDLDLTSAKLGKTEEAKNKLISKVLFHLDQINFDLASGKGDVLGDAYEYLIGQFASSAGKKAGEFYTPQQVSSILAKIVTHGKTRLKSVYDPTCGSGSLLLRVAREVEDVSDFFGQELNNTTYNLCRMNMILHGVHYRNFDIKQDDTLERPQHVDMKFDAVVANPPFSADWSANPIHLSDDRFSQYGRLAPKKKRADYAFVQHMIHHLDENGTMAVILPPGVLFREGAEGHIRKYLIKDKNYLDAVIGLPKNIFYGTAIPTCILVFKKIREAEDNVLFINASKEFYTNKPKNQLSEANVKKIINTYIDRKESEKFSRLVSLKEIEKNNYNLNITRYIDSFIKIENIHLDKVQNSLKLRKEERKRNELEIKEICLEINIPFPEGENLELLYLFKEGVMQKLFNRTLKFKDEFKNTFPEWKKYKINELGKTYAGLAKKTKEDFGSGKDYIQYMQVFSNSTIKSSGFGKVSIDDNERQSLVKFGDIIFTTSSETDNEVALSSVLLEEVDELYLNSFCFGFRLNSFQDLSPYFARYFFRSELFRQLVFPLSQGSTRYNIKKTALIELSIEIPCIDEQLKISNFLNLLDTKIEMIDSKSIQYDDNNLHFDEDVD